MKKCKKIKILFIPYYLNELSKKEKLLMENHLKECPKCQSEYNETIKFIKNLKILDKDFEEIASSINWEKIPESILRKLDKKLPAEPRRLFLLLNWKPIFGISSLLLMIIISSYFLFHFYITKTRNDNFYISKNSLKNIESSLAKEDTINYLKQSQLILTNFMEISSPEKFKPWAIKLNSQKVEQLLIQKKYFESNLSKLNLAKVEETCNKIELLLYEIALLDNQSSYNRIRNIQKTIKKENLLLKIRLLEKEIT